MGCDIHIFCEVKKQWPNKEVKPEWKTVGKIFKSTYYRTKEITVINRYSDNEQYESNERYTNEPYEGRNYNLFSILANVRNGYGFAGIDTGDGFIPISEPKGIPKDASDFYKQEVKSWNGDGHSHSWLTLKEIEDYDWDRITVKRGFVTPEQYKVFKKNGKPDEWCGGTTNPTYKQVEWKQTYRESVGDFLTKTVPNLKKILKFKDVLDLRLVFFFDN